MGLRVFVQAKFVEGALTQQYINQPGVGERGRRQAITSATLTPGSTTETTTFYLVPAGGAAGASNKIVAKALLSTDPTYTLPELVNQGLDPGDSVWAQCSTAAKHVFRMSGNSQPD